MIIINYYLDVDPQQLGSGEHSASTTQQLNLVTWGLRGSWKINCWKIFYLFIPLSHHLFDINNNSLISSSHSMMLSDDWSLIDWFSPVYRTLRRWDKTSEDVSGKLRQVVWQHGT